MSKPVLIATTIVLLGASETTAQTRRMEAALHIGPTLGWLRGNRIIDGSGVLPGLAASATLDYSFSKHFGIRAGFGYHRKGMSQEVTLTDNHGNVVREVIAFHRLDYLVVPLMARASFGNKARLVVGAGMYGGILMRSEQDRGDEQSFPTTDNTKDMEPWELGVSASLGGAFRLGEQVDLLAEVRYDKGLTNISALPVVDDGSIRTNALCLMVGFGYPFGSTR